MDWVHLFVPCPHPDEHSCLVRIPSLSVVLVTSSINQCSIIRPKIYRDQLSINALAAGNVSQKCQVVYQTFEDYCFFKQVFEVFFNEHLRELGQLDKMNGDTNCVIPMSNYRQRNTSCGINQQMLSLNHLQSTYLSVELEIKFKERYDSIQHKLWFIFHHPLMNIC